jgi:hypothetical protein
MLPVHGLRLKTAWGDAVAEIGKASYFRSFADTYIPYVRKAGVLSDSMIDDWYVWQQQSMKEGSFFASCNYYTFLASRM